VGEKGKKKELRKRDEVALIHGKSGNRPMNERELEDWGDRDSKTPKLTLLVKSKKKLRRLTYISKRRGFGGGGNLGEKGQ